MTPGVSVFSIADSATWSVITGTPDANYPVANLSGLIAPTQVARITPAAGVVALGFTMGAAALMQIAALVRHTAAAGTWRVRLYSGANQTGSLLADSGAVAIWQSGAPVTNYAASTPYVAPAAVTAQSGRIDFASLSGVLEIGAVELAQWWAWMGVSEGADIGFETTAVDVPLAGGGAEAGDVFTPRIYNGQIDAIALTVSQTSALDFQKSTALHKPFVFVQDYDDTTTWPRGCFLARNSAVPPMVGALYRQDRFQFRLKEHTR